MFKVNWRRSGAFIVNFKHISHLVPVFLLLTLNMQLPAGWVHDKSQMILDFAARLLAQVHI